SQQRRALDLRAHDRDGRDRLSIERRAEPMRPANAAVLEELQRSLLHPLVLQTAIRNAIALLTIPPQDIAPLQRELQSVSDEIDRLTEAIASGGSLDSLVTALQAREAKRTRLRADLTSLLADSGDAPLADDVTADLSARLAEWRAIFDEADGPAVTAA